MNNTTQFPYAGMPYPLAPTWCFMLAEISIFVFFAFCAWVSIRADRRRLAYLVGGFTFGVLLERVGVSTGYYWYGSFYFMLGQAPYHVPLCVGAAWGIIIYSARLFSDSLLLPLFAAAALDALLALNIDLSMDVVAYRLHMWHWVWKEPAQALSRQWFGVPYNNLIGWLAVVYFYSTFSRLFERRLTQKVSIQRAMYAIIIALTLSLSIFAFSGLVLLPLLIRLGFQSGNWLVVFVTALGLTVINGWSTTRRLPPAFLSPLMVWVPLWFHLFFVGCFFWFGIYRESSWMTGVAIANFLVGLVIHLYHPIKRNKPFLILSPSRSQD